MDLRVEAADHNSDLPSIFSNSTSKMRVAPPNKEIKSNTRLTSMDIKKGREEKFTRFVSITTTNPSVTS